MTINSRDATCGCKGQQYDEHRPTHPGYYWMKRGPVETVVRVLAGGLNILTIGSKGVKPTKDFDAEWCGPIRPPGR